MRQSISDFSLFASAIGVSATSHSSRHQLSSDHHSPLLRHGPACFVVRKRWPSSQIVCGTFSVMLTRMATGGRHTRSAVFDAATHSAFAVAAGLKVSMRKL